MAEIILQRLNDYIERDENDQNFELFIYTLNTSVNDLERFIQLTNIYGNAPVLVQLNNLEILNYIQARIFNDAFELVENPEILYQALNIYPPPLPTFGKEELRRIYLNLRAKFSFPHIL